MKSAFSSALKFIARQRFLTSSRRSSERGFTMLELLVATFIAGGIITGLTYMVMELLGTDQREATRTESQRELQTAMDYIANDLRQSIYVYDGACLGRTPRGTVGADNFCPGLSNHLPAAIAVSGRSVPILAFWKQQPIPRSLHAACRAGTAAEDVPCLNAHSPALVVYSLNKDNTGNLWRGRARITRYVLSQFYNDGTPNPGYVDPLVYNNWQTWPYAQEPGTTSGIVSLQRQAPGGPIVPLADFVDDGTGSTALGLTRSGTCPDDPATINVREYAASPDAAVLSSLGFANVRSFYACVSAVGNIMTTQDVLLFLQGNPRGRAGINSDRSIPPILETRVLTRGLRGFSPTN